MTISYVLNYRVVYSKGEHEKSWDMNLSFRQKMDEICFYQNQKKEAAMSVMGRRGKNLFFSAIEGTHDTLDLANKGRKLLAFSRVSDRIFR